MSEVWIGSHPVGFDHPVALVGEIGINANGDIHVARSLMGCLKRAGWHFAKFQKRDLRNDGQGCYTKTFLDSPRDSPWGTTQREQKAGLEFDRDDYQGIDAESITIDLPWFASPWDVPSVEFLARFNVPCYKIASPMLAHRPVLEAVRAQDKPVIISTGMADQDRLDRVVQFFVDHVPVLLVQCAGVYPCPPHCANLAQIPALRARYGIPVGYSGHELGLAASQIAVALGACLIERHVTLDRSAYGSDQAVSLEVPELYTLATQVHAIRDMLGTPEKRLLDEERPFLEKLREQMAFQGDTDD